MLDSTDLLFRISDLPQELLDAIIDHLHNDESSLYACSLVCSSWTSPSQYHLFSKIRITERGEIPRSSRFQDVLTTFQSTPFTHRWYIQDFTLSGWSLRAPTKWSRYARTIHLDFLAAFLLELPVLRRLCLEDVVVKKRNSSGSTKDGVFVNEDFDSEDDGVDKRPEYHDCGPWSVPSEHLQISPSSAVRTLSLSNVQILYVHTEVRILSELLTLFPNLATIHTHNAFFTLAHDRARFPCSIPEVPVSTLPKVLNLEVTGLAPAPPVALFQLIREITSSSSEPFHRLSFDCNDHTDLEALESLINHPSGTLPVLHCKLHLFRGSFMHGSLRTQVSFTKCLALQSLHLTVSLHRALSSVEPLDINYAIAIIESLPSSPKSITHLSLRFIKERNFELDRHRIGTESIAWERLDTAVSRLGEMETFEFEYRLNGEGLLEEEMRFVEGNLEKMYSSGRLRVL